MNSRAAPESGRGPDGATSPGRPTVSVVIPCHNAIGFVPEALDSVLGQTFPDYEIVVVNDGSPETAALEALLRPYRSRIRYLRQEHRGPAAARNLGIRHAAAEYVAFLDSDDVWLPGFLAAHVRALDEDASLDLVYGNSVLFGTHFLPTGTIRGQAEPTFENLVLRRCHVHPTCVVARRASIVAVGSFDERLTFSEDLDLWARLVYHGARIRYVPAVLARRRVHAGSLTVAVDRLIRGQREMSLNLLDTLPALTAEQRGALESNVERCTARLRLVHGTGHLLQGRYEQALADIEAANEVLRSWKLRAAIAALRVAPRQARRLSRFALDRHPVGEQLRALGAAGGAMMPDRAREAQPMRVPPGGAGDLAPQCQPPE